MCFTHQLFSMESLTSVTLFLGVAKTNYVENPDYEPVSIKDLTDASMSFWVHHTSYILKQGRTTWWNPSENEAEVI